MSERGRPIRRGFVVVIADDYLHGANILADAGKNAQHFKAPIECSCCAIIATHIGLRPSVLITECAGNQGDYTCRLYGGLDANALRFKTKHSS
jgi:hypothetical protein